MSQFLTIWKHFLPYKSLPKPFFKKRYALIKHGRTTKSHPSIPNYTKIQGNIQTMLKLAHDNGHGKTACHINISYAFPIYLKLNKMELGGGEFQGHVQDQKTARNIFCCPLSFTSHSISCWAIHHYSPSSSLPPPLSFSPCHWLPSIEVGFGGRNGQSTKDAVRNS